MSAGQISCPDSGSGETQGRDPQRKGTGHVGIIRGAFVEEEEVWDVETS